MNITAVEIRERQSGILLPDFESVKGALQAYSQGQTKDSNATMQTLVSAGGGVAAMMMALVQPSAGSFVGRLCDEIETGLTERTRFERSYDYDGVGPFFKTNVTVQRLENDSYLLQLSAAYVGNTIEEGLANYIGALRGLSWVDLTIQLDDTITDGRFAIDFNPINEKLGGTVLWTRNGAGIAEIIAAGHKTEGSSLIMDAGTAILMGGELRDSVDPSAVDDQITVGIGIVNGSVGRYYGDPFVANKSVVTGPPWTDQDGEPRQPEVFIHISGNPSEDRYWQLPVLDPEVQARMRSLAADVKERFGV